MEESGRKRRGRLKLRQRESVKRDLNRAGVKSQGWERMAEGQGWGCLIERVEQPK